MLDEAPPGDLGPQYTIDWMLAGPSGDDLVTQDLYPYAENGPVTYLERASASSGPSAPRAAGSRAARR